jgi:hypothetical protein
MVATIVTRKGTRHRKPRFPASRPGVCAKCEKSIRTGELITRAGRAAKPSQAWQHAGRCTTKSSQETLPLAL